MSAWVLLVEDSPADTELLTQAWRRSGVTTRLETVADGVEALERIVELVEHHRELPVVVLTDLKMPRMDGGELLRRLREQDATRALPVVVLTSSEEPADIDRCYRLGANGFVVKPIGGRLDGRSVAAITTFWGEVNHRPVDVA